MKRVKIFASGGDGKAKGVLNGYGQVLYVGMDGSYLKVIDSKIILDRLSLGPLDDKEVFIYKDHKEIVDKMLSVVSKQSPTNIARRFFYTGTAVSNWKRRSGEG